MGHNSALTYDSLPIHQIQSDEQSELLERLGELRRLGLNHQELAHKLVICGDQNSGKSAVFEAITGIQLPVNNGISTRFVVEVVLRRAPDVSAQVKIRPGVNASPDHRHKLGVFSRPHNWLSDIPKLFSEARLIMGLTRGGSYSEDVLHLEISGPTLPDITVVDLPGLLNLPHEGQTMEDVAIAKAMTDTYLKNPRHIIVAVISAERQLSEQMVLHSTRNCSVRTMVVVTKLDLLEPDTPIIAKIYDRVKQQNSPQKLGWHLLRNMDSESPERPPRVTRNDIEELFFLTVTPWRTLPPQFMGVNSLRKKIHQKLLAGVKQQLLTISSDINIGLDTHRKLLEKLGVSSHTTIERRMSLVRMGERFQSLTKAAIYGEYHDPYFRYRPTHAIRRLRATISNWTDNFSQEMRSKGHSYDIYDDNIALNNTSPRPVDEPQAVSRSEFMASLREFVKQSKGREISGLMNAQVIGELFIRNSLKWRSIARNHVFQMWTKIKHFLSDLLHYIADESIGETLISKIVNIEMKKKMEMLQDKVDELVAPFKKVIPTIVDPELKARIAQIRSKVDSETQAGLTATTYYPEILHCMLAYYSAALNTFVNNIASLAIEGCLIDGLEDIISPSKFVQMSDDDIEIIATESEDVRMTRVRLKNQVRMLELAAAACTRCELVYLEATSDHYRVSSESKDSERSIGSDSSSAGPSSSGSDAEMQPTVQPDLPPRLSSRKQSHHSLISVLRAFPSKSKLIDKPLTTNIVSRPPTAPSSPATDKLPPFSQMRHSLKEPQRADSKSKSGKLTKRPKSKYVSSISE